MTESGTLAYRYAVPSSLSRDGVLSFATSGGAPDDTRTCPWWGKHQGTRGPCKHVLVARIVRRAAVGQSG